MSETSSGQIETPTGDRAAGGDSAAAAVALSSSSSDDRQPLLERGSLAVFEVFADVTEATVVSFGLWAVLQLFSLLQLLLLPLGPDGTWAADSSASAGGVAGIVPAFQGFLLSVTFTPWTQTAGATPIAAFSALSVWAVAAAFFAALLALFGAAAARAFVANRELRGAARGAAKGAPQQRRGDKSGLFELRLLIAAAVIGLPVPLVGNLLLPVVCPSGTWAGFACWTDPTHVAVSAVSIIILAIGAPFLVLAASIFQSRLPDLKLHPTAVSHGRVEALSMAVKLVMTVVFIAGTALSRWVHLLVNLAGGVALVALIISYLPHLDQTLNHIEVASNCVFLAAAAAAVVTEELKTAVSLHDAVSTGGVVLCFLAPVLAYAGSLLVSARYHALLRSKAAASPYSIELRVRAMVAEAGMT